MAKVADTLPSCMATTWIIFMTAICIIRMATTWMNTLSPSAPRIPTNARLAPKATTGNTFTAPIAATLPFRMVITWITWWTDAFIIRTAITATTTGPFKWLVNLSRTTSHVKFDDGRRRYTQANGHEIVHGLALVLCFNSQPEKADANRVGPGELAAGTRFAGGKQNRAGSLSTRSRMMFDLHPYHSHRIAVSICESGQQTTDDHEEESGQEQPATPE